MKPWRSVSEADRIDVVAPDGTIRSTVQAWFGGTHFFIEDMSVDVQPGDEIRRLLPNGKEETFIVDDPTFYRNGPFGSHYQVKISRRGVFSRHTGGHYQVTVSGENSRVNIGSHDASTNISVSDNIFEQVRAAFESSKIEPERLAQLREQITALERAKDRPTFLQAYQGLVAGAADHIGVLAPFLPALTGLLTGLPLA